MEIRVKDFNLEATLESGQVFGFERGADGVYEGVINNTRVRLRQDRTLLWVEGNGAGKIVAGRRQLEDSIQTYFDLEHDLTRVYRFLCEDKRLEPVYRQFKGLRIIRQDPWEALACFIISANNNIKRIQGIRRNLSRAFSSSNFEFPKASDIARSNEGALRRLGLGYRAPFLLEAARQVSRDSAGFRWIRQASYENAKVRLMKYPGVGDKVADCVLLFGFQKYEAFPVDVWVLRIMHKLYFRNRKVSEQKVRAFGLKRWGRYAGYVQQYLYHGSREGIL